MPGRRVRYDGREAAAFASKLEIFQKKDPSARATGEGAERRELRAISSFEGGVFDITFELPSEDGAPEGAPVRRLHQMEIASGPFERRVHIPVAFDRDRVSARLANGFLTVSLAKRGRRTIPIGQE